MLWFKPKKVEIERVAHEEQSNIEVIKLKNKTKQSVVKTKKDIDRLNKLLKANGITLRIHIATKGNNHA
jgi:hypothetical protein